MSSLKKPIKLYLKHLTDFLDTCTTEDARTMIILGLLGIISALFDFFHKII